MPGLLVLPISALDVGLFVSAFAVVGIRNENLLRLAGDDGAAAPHLERDLLRCVSERTKANHFEETLVLLA
jgi:hypothetical protein